MGRLLTSVHQYMWALVSTSQSFFFLIRRGIILLVRTHAQSDLVLLGSVHFFNEQGGCPVQLLYLEFSSKSLVGLAVGLEALIYWIMDAISSSVDERARWFMIETAKRWRPRTKRAFLFISTACPCPWIGLPSSKLTMISTSSLNGHDKRYT